MNNEEDYQYQDLDSKRIVKTINILSIRIDERFPNSGLFKVSQKLLNIATRAKEQSLWIDRPIISIRVISGLLIAIILFALFGTIANVITSVADISFLEFIQVLEAGINDVVLIGLAIFFLSSLESPFKRHKALKAIHELRAIAHIIDMHQLTKDPVRMHWVAKGKVKPRTDLTPFLLTRYLDYCSEMLSLLSKVSVLYVQKFDDPIALSAVNEVENLTTSLSRKIWQKLMIIHQGINSNEN